MLEPGTIFIAQNIACGVQLYDPDGRRVGAAHTLGASPNAEIVSRIRSQRKDGDLLCRVNATASLVKSSHDDIS